VAKKWVQYFFQSSLLSLLLLLLMLEISSFEATRAQQVPPFQRTTLRSEIAAFAKKM
jgi:hypothetical protein